jgi:hypothetical protein
MASSGMLRHVALAGTDVSEEPSTSFIRVKRVGEKILVITSYRCTLRRNTKEALSSSQTSVLTRVTRRNIPEDAILHSHRRENLKSYNIRMISSVHNFIHIMYHVACNLRFKRIYESVRREALYNILIEFGVPYNWFRRLICD